MSIDGFIYKLFIYIYTYSAYSIKQIGYSLLFFIENNMVPSKSVFLRYIIQLDHAIRLCGPYQRSH